MKFKAQIMDEASFNRVLVRMAHQIIENNRNCRDIRFIGIKTRGIPIAHFLSDNIEKFENIRIPVGTIDITLYRDDLDSVSDVPVVNESDIPFDIDGKTVILVDDVIFTGRTARAALEAVIKHGRPAKIQLAVMVDRGHRELPIRPDYIGKNIPTSMHEIVAVCVDQIDNKTGVDLYENEV